ncbi:hypothetical protein ZIOFF_021942 [Zingiber officinale]|uniref:Protein transport protein Sec61 subunit gamma n=3 Tax=Magnoliopsida TaxID=3398 RepID=A0A8J5HAJ5_ZINOF|nr:hypothetical protein ZIOFF_021942 [Zingiber officinale]
MDALDSVVDPLREFSKDSIRLVKRCHKPDRKEFTKVAVRTAIGFVVMGFVGFFVKLIFIPINNIIVGSGVNGDVEGPPGDQKLCCPDNSAYLRGNLSVCFQNFKSFNFRFVTLLFNFALLVLLN